MAAALSAAGLLIVFGLVTRGGLALLPWLSRRAHAAGDAVVAVALCAGPLVFSREIGLSGTVFVVGAGVVLGLVSLRTRYEPSRKSGIDSTSIIDATAQPVGRSTSQGGDEGVVPQLFDQESERATRPADQGERPFEDH